MRSGVSMPMVNVDRGARAGQQQRRDLREPQLIDQVLMRSAARADDPPHECRQRHG